LHQKVCQEIQQSISAVSTDTINTVVDYLLQRFLQCAVTVFSSAVK